jgi:hypothetical protein
MAWNELGKGVHHRNDGLGEIVVFHAGGTPQGAGTSHVATGGRGFGTVCGHRGVRISKQ